MKAGKSLLDNASDKTSRIKTKTKSKTGYTWPVFDLLGQAIAWSDDFTILPAVQRNRMRRKSPKLKAKTAFLKKLLEDTLAYDRDAEREQSQRNAELVREIFEESQAEADVIDELVKSVSELEPRDTRFTQVLMQEVHGPFPRLLLYFFLPIAAYDFIKVRANVDALRRLRQAATAYKNYSELVRSYLFQTLEDRQIVREAFLGVMNLRSSRQKLPLIRSKIIHSIREFADWADQYLSARHLDPVMIDGVYHELYEDSDEAFANRNQIVRLATESYIKDQVFKRIDAVSFTKRFQGMVLFAENMSRFNPFARMFML